MSGTIEKRARFIEKRSDKGMKVGGWAALFDVETDIGGYFREKIAPGAFSDALNADVRPPGFFLGIRGVEDFIGNPIVNGG